MAFTCQRCAIRIQHAAAQSFTRNCLAKRTFTTTPSCQKTVPYFSETSNTELNSLLLTLRDKHFIPASLSSNERRFIFDEKNKQTLQDNPRFVTLADSDKQVQLEHISKENGTPKRSKLLAEVIDLISKGKGDEWTALLPLLRAMKTVVKSSLLERQIEKIIRFAGEQHKLGEILRCLNHAEHTGWSLEQDIVLRNLLLSIRNTAHMSGWEAGSTARAMKRTREVATMLETEQHGAGRITLGNDTRKSPEVIGVFLEIAAVNAFKHQNMQDDGGVVQAYAQRLLANIAEQDAEQPKSLVLSKHGVQHAFNFAVSIFHGLNLAEKILGRNMPSADLARKVIANYGLALKDSADKLQERNPERASHAGKALSAWEDARGRVEGET